VGTNFLPSSSDLELPSVPEDYPGEDDDSYSEDKVTSPAQNIPGESSKANHDAVISPPESLSVVSSLTDSDPPSPRGERVPQPGLETSDSASAASSLPSHVEGTVSTYIQILKE